MYIVYIIQSQKDFSYYTGSTTNLEKRIKEHNLGLSKYTSQKRPFELYWYCVFKDKNKAIKF